MPDVSRAEITSSATDLTPYTAFLKKLSQGQVVTLPLEAGESSRAVMRSLNAAAHQSGVRLGRLASADGTVRFRVLTPQKRAAGVSPQPPPPPQATGAPALRRRSRKAT